MNPNPTQRTKIMKTLPLIAAAALTLSACAPAPGDIAAAYVSPTAFSGRTCAALNSDATVLNARLVAATGQQQAAADNDAAMVGIGMLIFWPMLFAVGGNDQSPAIAQMRGEAEAIRSAAVSRGC